MTDDTPKRTSYKRPPLTKPNAVHHYQHQQEDETDRMASRLVGRTIEDLKVELKPSGDNLFLLRVTRNVYNDQGDIVQGTENVTLVFNEIGIGVEP